MVEGDSASVAETVAFLSALAGVPISQSIAVTGSINQSGRVQPVGGVQYKVEGFYELCKMKGLDGKQGVIVPDTNFDNLVLPDEIVEALKSKKFNIWTIETVDEAIELLTGMKAGEIGEEGSYPEETFNYLVTRELQRLYDISSKDKSN